MLGAQNRFLASLEMTILKLLEMPLTAGKQRLAAGHAKMPTVCAILALERQQRSEDDRDFGKSIWPSMPMPVTASSIRIRFVGMSASRLVVTTPYPHAIWY